MSSLTRLFLIILLIVIGMTAYTISQFATKPRSDLFSLQNVERVRDNQPKLPAETSRPTKSQKAVNAVRQWVDFDLRQITCLQQNIYFESRGESVRGRLATAWVTLNRVNSRHYPETICKVVKQGLKDANGNPLKYKCKFTWYCDGKADTPTEEDAWADAGNLAEMFYRECRVGQTAQCPPDPTQGALYYHTNWVEPSWKFVYNETTRIGSHVYYTR